MTKKTNKTKATYRDRKKVEIVVVDLTQGIIIQVVLLGIRATVLQCSLLSQVKT